MSRRESVDQTMATYRGHLHIEEESAAGTEGSRRVSNIKEIRSQLNAQLKDTIPKDEVQAELLMAQMAVDSAILEETEGIETAIVKTAVQVLGIMCLATADGGQKKRKVLDS